MSLDGADPLFEALDSFLNLAIGELNKRTGFPELFIQMGSILGMAPVEVHLKSFGNQLKFMPKSFGENASMPFGFDDFFLKGFSRHVSVSFDVGDLYPNGFSRGSDDLLNLRQRFLIHAPLPEGFRARGTGSPLAPH